MFIQNQCNTIKFLYNSYVTMSSLDIFKIFKYLMVQPEVYGMNLVQVEYFFQVHLLAQVMALSFVFLLLCEKEPAC